jgi:hypothetical protein
MSKTTQQRRSSFDRFTINFPVKLTEKGNGKPIKLLTREELLEKSRKRDK